MKVTENYRGVASICKWFFKSFLGKTFKGCSKRASLRSSSLNGKHEKRNGEKRGDRIGKPAYLPIIYPAIKPITRFILLSSK